MTRLGLILRNLAHFRSVNLALILGMAVATAVLTGALMVGDSVQGSLADLTRHRLGKIDDALLGRRFFNQTLVERMRTDPTIAGRYELAGAVLLTGSAANEDESARARNVQIAATQDNWMSIPQGRCILNGPTADALAISRAGATVLLSLPDDPDQPRDAALARRSREDTLAAMRLGVLEVHRQKDTLSLFNPMGGQRVPQNTWVNLPELQRQIELPGLVNTILVHDGSAGESEQSAQPLNHWLSINARLEDYGIQLEKDANTGEFALVSRQIYLDPPLIDAAESAARSQHIPLQKVTVNLLTSVKTSGGKEIYYAVGAGITSLGKTALADDQIAINQWTADQLGARVGDHIHLTFYRRTSEGNLQQTSTDQLGFPSGFQIVSILPMSGIGADRMLTPRYKGLVDADTVADWNPPEGIEIDKRLVTRADEDYWKRYNAAPKLFLSFSTARKLWGEAGDSVTSLRLPADNVESFRKAMEGNPKTDQGGALDPAAMGLSFTPIKAQQLAASSGNTDFGQYFLYFSFFIIVAAVLLVAMLFRLNIEQRARQLGLLAAVGFAPWSLRRLALGEGMLLACIGGWVGVPAAIGYTAFIMYGLRHWWSGAVGTSELYPHVATSTLVSGYVASIAVAFLAILWAVWQVGRTRAATLLAGGWGHRRLRRGSGRVSRFIGAGMVMLGLLIMLWAVVGRAGESNAFLGGGTLLLMGSLFYLAGVMRPGIRRGTGSAGIATVARLGVRNASRHTARGVLAIGLIAFAAFTLITVASFRQHAPSDTGDPASGAGGYRLIATSGIPLLGDLNTEYGRRILGITDPAAPLWNQVRFVSMRRWAGQDISCLNLTQPTQPAILSVPPQLWQTRSGAGHRFTFAQSLASQANPWLLLSEAQSDQTIPVITDENTAQYILKLELGKILQVADQAGQPRQLKLVATLSNSIFQSELLMSESNFRQLFGRVDGFSVVLADTPPDPNQVQQALNAQLGEYAVDAEPTSYRLQQYLDVQNTYLSTFGALGALGLMLGTVGLAVVLVRTVLERKAELALLASLGFARGDRVWLVLCENLFLLIVGLLVGAACALLGIIPAIRRSAQTINYGYLAGTLGGVLILGIICSSLAVWFSGAHVSPADLRRE